MPISSQKIWEEAIKAKEYARSKIKKGATQLENNTLDIEYLAAVSKGTRDVRDAIIEQKDPLRLETDNLLYRYEKLISISGKHSLGNCCELAHHALDYFLTQVKEAIPAELYEIKGGDHLILVVGRNPNSDPLDPTTWEKAVICDPWANEVYLATEYLSKLKNYVFSASSGRRINMTEKFNPREHALAPFGKLNTSCLTDKRSIDLLKENFLAKSNEVIQVLKDHQAALQHLANELSKKYSDADVKVIELQNKIKEIAIAIQTMEQQIKDVIKNKMNGKDDRIPELDDYRIVKNNFRKAIQQMLNDSVKVLTFSEDAAVKLVDYREKNKKFTKLMMFFNYPSRTKSAIKKIIKKTNEAIKKI